MPMMCDECKCSNWYCNECGESSHHDCDCSCCGCKCQTQPTNQIGETIMTELTPTESQVAFTLAAAGHVQPFEAQAFDKAIGDLKDELKRVQESRDSYLDRYHKARATTSAIIKSINESIKELELTTEDSFPMDTLAEIFEDNGCELKFDRLFKVEIEYTIRARVEIEAASADDAESAVKENVSLTDIEIDGNLVDWDVYDESVNSVEEA